MFAVTIQVGSLSHKQPSFIFFLSLELIHGHCLPAYLIEVAVALIMHVSEHHWSIHFHSMSSTSVSVHQSMMLQHTHTQLRIPMLIVKICAQNSA